MRSQALLAALIASSLALPALAQSAPVTPPRTSMAADSPGAIAHPGRGHGRKDPKKRVARQREKLEQALKSAGIDDARAKRVVAIHAKHSAERLKAFEQMRTQRQALKQLLDTKSKDEAAYRRALDGLRTGRKKLAELRDKESAEASQVLKPSEFARVLSERRAGRQGKSNSPGRRKHGAKARNRGAL
jgi:Spy/CpxP family protein refolding chaperone